MVNDFPDNDGDIDFSQIHTINNISTDKIYAVPSVSRCIDFSTCKYPFPLEKRRMLADITNVVVFHGKIPRVCRFQAE